MFVQTNWVRNKDNNNKLTIKLILFRHLLIVLLITCYHHKINKTCMCRLTALSMKSIYISHYNQCVNAINMGSLGMSGR